MYAVLSGCSVSTNGFTATFANQTLALAVWLLVNEEIEVDYSEMSQRELIQHIHMLENHLARETQHRIILAARWYKLGGFIVNMLTERIPSENSSEEERQQLDMEFNLISKIDEEYLRLRKCMTKTEIGNE